MTSMQGREEVAQARRWVVKLGSSLVTNQGKGIDPTAIARFAAQIAARERTVLSVRADWRPLMGIWMERFSRAVV
jgi:hypothetical protein